MRRVIETVRPHEAGRAGRGGCGALLRAVRLAAMVLLIAAPAGA
ncbi:hypothetical protein EV668_4879, partial [Enterovirga rhinocerotis]